MNLKWPEQMPNNHRLLKNDDAGMTGLISVFRNSRRKLALLLTAFALALAVCAGAHAGTAIRTASLQDVELSSGGTLALNYTPWYIHTFEMQGPAGSGIGGGGPNVMPMHEDGSPSGGAKETCCTRYPRQWQPDLRLTVRWLVYKDVKTLGAKAPGHWYKAENVRIAQYDGKQAGGIWTIFLPGDRVRIMITDGNHDGGNNPNNRPADNDPYLVQGVLDDEWDRLFPDGVAQGVAR
jgi:hypothetical protein